ncbi:biotin/lipoyl-binding protein [bacterium]|nr:biotin/lipoyl-binding protein [bacterium]
MRAILVFLLIIGFGIAGCQRVADMPDSTGTFEATVVEVSCVEPGQILSLPVEEGQELQQGDTIAVIDTTRLAIERTSTRVSLRELTVLREQADSKLELAEIQYKAAEREFLRAQTLHDKGSIRSVEFDQHQTQFDVAKNTLQSARIARNELNFKEQLLR